ncbi:MAG: ATP-binding cassette domain-containing protein [Planctomycetes bacterium]|jgi:sodium transport system ATP-binding protein|nr:ATP-binding cassette domain-containing protein [Planctomycetota bacterium]
MELVQVKNLRKSYADYQRDPFVAVESLSFSAKAGEVFGLLGPNGAGKTTALRILATVLQPTSGQAFISNFDVVSQAEMVRCSIGFVSNNTAIYERMTAWEMVEFFGRLYCVPISRLRERMESLFVQLKMTDFRDCPGARMSTGMKQKVSIARALIHDPPVLIFDEPTLGLDVLATRALHQIIIDLRDQGKCILFSTHIMREVERLCDRVAIMNRGQVLDSGSLPELSDRHKTSDFEELFYQLIMASEQSRSKAATRGIWFEDLGVPGVAPMNTAGGM